MTNNKAYSLLADTLITKADTVFALEFLSSIRELIYKKDMSKIIQKFEKKIPEKYFHFFELLTHETETPVELDKLLSKIEQIISKIPVAHIQIGYTPTRYQVEQLANKLRQKFPKETVIDYSINRDAGLGIQIDFNGRTYKKYAV